MQFPESFEEPLQVGEAVCLETDCIKYLICATVKFQRIMAYWKRQFEMRIISMCMGTTYVFTVA
jgi:hypothetical protein